MELQRNAIIDTMGKDIPGDVPKGEVVPLSEMSTKWNMSPEQGCIPPARLFYPSTRSTKDSSKFMASGFVEGHIIKLKNYKARKSIT